MTSTTDCPSRGSLNNHSSNNQNDYTIDTTKYYCPFLDRGFCRDKTKCNFSHVQNNSIRVPLDYCHFYLANKCLYGVECIFQHLEPCDDLSTTSTTCTYADTSTSGLSACSSNQANDHIGNNVDQIARIHQQGNLCRRHSIGNIDMISDEHLLLSCDLCGQRCLQPTDLEQQRLHRDECLRELEQEMELSFAIQRSKDKVCGICMDVVSEKKPVTSSRFGILEKCNHIFCLDCIRKWRGTKQFENRTIRACPECRTCSDFVVPSQYWVEDKDDKEKLIHDYKANLKSKACKYFDQGRGECPFAGACFYKHAYPDGRIAKFTKPSRRYNSRGISLAAARLIVWNLIRSTDDEDDDEDEDEVVADSDDEFSDRGNDVLRYIEEMRLGEHLSSDSDDESIFHEYDYF